MRLQQSLLTQSERTYQVISAVDNILSVVSRVLAQSRPGCHQLPLKLMNKLLILTDYLSHALLHRVNVTRQTVPINAIARLTRRSRRAQ